MGVLIFYPFQRVRLLTPHFGSIQLRVFRKKAPDTEVVRSRTQQSPDQRPHDWYPEDRRSAGQPVVTEARDHREQTGPEVARGIDGIPVHAAKRHADRYYYE